jgi:hypothetical protein
MIPKLLPHLESLRLSILYLNAWDQNVSDSGIFLILKYLQMHNEMYCEWDQCLDTKFVNFILHFTHP